MLFSILNSIGDDRQTNLIKLLCFSSFSNCRSNFQNTFYLTEIRLEKTDKSKTTIYTADGRCAVTNGNIYFLTLFVLKVQKVSVPKVSIVNHGHCLWSLLLINFGIVTKT